MKPGSHPTGQWRSPTSGDDSKSASYPVYDGHQTLITGGVGGCGTVLERTERGIGLSASHLPAGVPDKHNSCDYTEIDYTAAAFIGKYLHNDL